MIFGLIPSFFKCQKLKKKKSKIEEVVLFHSVYFVKMTAADPVQQVRHRMQSEGVVPLKGALNLS